MQRGLAYVDGMFHEPVDTRRRRLVGRLLALVAVLPQLVLFGCGETDDKPDSPQQRNQLVFTTPDGATIAVTPRAVECAPSEYDPHEQVVQIHDFTKDYNLVVEVLPEDVVNGKTFDLPIDAGDMQDGPANALLFFGDKSSFESNFEVSSSEEESTGTLEVLRASCDPAALEMTVSATLDSEFFDGEDLEVEGRVMLPD